VVCWTVLFSYCTFEPCKRHISPGALNWSAYGIMFLVRPIINKSIICKVKQENSPNFILVVLTIVGWLVLGILLLFILNLRVYLEKNCLFVVKLLSFQYINSVDTWLCFLV
jgi:hypothetical protein